MGDSIEVVYCNVVIKRSANIVAHALIESFFLCNVEGIPLICFYSLGLQFFSPKRIYF